MTAAPQRVEDSMLKQTTRENIDYSNYENPFRTSGDSTTILQEWMKKHKQSECFNMSCEAIKSMMHAEKKQAERYFTAMGWIATVSLILFMTGVKVVIVVPSPTQ